jgi:hypothetical protein
VIDPINVWYSGDVMFSDYRLPDGRIGTVETRRLRYTLDEVLAQLGETAMETKHTEVES